MKDIKPCPFCGNKAEINEGHDHSYIGGYSVNMSLDCTYCSANMQDWHGRDGAKIRTKEECITQLITDWNNRING